MKAILRYPLFLLSLALVTNSLQGQTIDTILGSDDFPQSFAEIEECTICSYEMSYGSTFSYSSSNSGENCQSTEIDQFVGFVTNAAGDVAFNLETFNCLTGSGLQLGVYDRFNQQVFDCFAPEDRIYRFPNLEPDALYFIRIAGKSGDECAFFLQMLSGIVAWPSCAANVSNTSNIQALGFEVFQSSQKAIDVYAPNHGWNLSLVDLLGREVLSTTLQKDINQLDVDHLVAGTYFVMIRKGAQTASMKWVKR